MPVVLAWICLAFGLMIAAVWAARRARVRGSWETPRGECQACGQRGPVTHVNYFQNTGMVVARRERSVDAIVCRRCSTRLFVRMNLHNLVLGW